MTEKLFTGTLNKNQNKKKKKTGMTWTHCVGIRVGVLTGGLVTQEIQIFEGRFLHYNQILMDHKSKSVRNIFFFYRFMISDGFGTSILAFTSKTGQSFARITHILFILLSQRGYFEAFNMHYFRLHT